MIYYYTNTSYDLGLRYIHDLYLSTLDESSTVVTDPGIQIEAAVRVSYHILSLRYN